MWTKEFWADLIERAVKAAVWSVLGLLGVGATGTLTGVDWLAVLNVAGYTFVIAVLLNLVGNKVVKLGAPDSASFLPPSLDPPKKPARRKR